MGLVQAQRINLRAVSILYVTGILQVRQSNMRGMTRKMSAIGVVRGRKIPLAPMVGQYESAGRGQRRRRWINTPHPVSQIGTL